VAAGRVGDDVVDVALDGGAGAPGEGAGAVAELDLLGQAGGDLVGSHADVLVDVEDRLDDDGGGRVFAPRADLFGEHGAVVVVDLCQFETAAGAARDRCLGEVHVEHHLTRLRGRTLRVVEGSLQFEAEVAAGELPGGDGATYVERVGGTRQPERFGLGGDGGVQVKGICQVEFGLAGRWCRSATPGGGGRSRDGPRLPAEHRTRPARA
jgi:hypothetical protein